MFEWNRQLSLSANMEVEGGVGFSSSGSVFPRSRPRGQALILVVLALLVLCLGIIVLFDTGQVVSKKVKLVNTADEAAYSAAVQEARALNLIAYMNRASVANEVAMAQMVSWYSWANFAISATDHLKDALEVLAVLGLIVPEVEPFVIDAIAALRDAKMGLEEGRNVAQGAFKEGAVVVAGLNGAYSQGSLVLSRGMATDASDVAREVVKLNDPKASISAIGWSILLQDVAAASKYVERYSIPSWGGSGNKSADRLKNVVMEARDPFSRQRDGTLFFFFKKYGGTDLVNYRSWVGLDTLNLEFTSGSPPLEEKHDIPLGWGGGAGVDQTTMSFSSLARQDSGWFGPYRGNDPRYADSRRYAAYSNALGNGKAGDLVLSRPAQDGQPWITSGAGRRGARVGLPDYNDIAPNKATLPYENGKSALENGVGAIDAGPVFTVLVAQPMNTVRTTNNIPGIGGPPDFQVRDQAMSGEITAMASAQTYFGRPRSLFPRLTDPKREMGSLFSPYWQARLVQTPQAIRAEVGGASVVAP